MFKSNAGNCQAKDIHQEPADDQTGMCPWTDTLLKVAKTSQESLSSLSAAADLLTQAVDAGLTLAMPEPGNLKLRGDPAAVACWAPILRPHKLALVRLLSDRQADVAEATAERAAVVEYLGGLTRDRAQAVAEVAGACYRHHWSCAACRAGTHVGSKLHQPCQTGARLWDDYCLAAERAGGAR